MRSLAMRLYHLGLRASVVGDMGCPPVANGDLLLVSAGPGWFSTVEALLKQAKSAGATCAVITAQTSGKCAEIADIVVCIPAQTMADDMLSAPDSQAVQEGQNKVLPMGSVYEGALFVVGEVVVRMLRDMLGETAESMRERHTNLE